MFMLPPLIEPLFTAAGWRPKSQIAQAVRSQASAQDRVREIVEAFGNLRVGQSGPGTEQAASDVHFYSSPRPEVSVAAAAWHSQIGNCAAFGTAHNDHMILLVNDEGTYYVFTDPDECLYELGNTFGEVMQRLLWGYSYGSLLARDA